MRGGFIGVDCFFVLSGYVVTLVLLDTTLPAGRAILAFYARRIQRLFPAAALTIIIVAVVWLLVSAPVERATVLGDARPAALYYANWHFSGQSTDYFAHYAAPSPLLHFWSLSVEEQFYFTWPLVALLALRVRSRKTGALRLAVITTFLASLSLCELAELVASGHSDPAYYSTFARAYQLLAGALLAVWLQYRRKQAASGPALQPGPLLQLTGLPALVLVASDVCHFAPTTRGIAAVMATGLLISGLELAPYAPVARLLNNRAAVAVGGVSYSIYLVHYPVILLLNRFIIASSLVVASLTLTLSVALASVSARALELPIRRAPALGRRPGLVVAVGLAFSLLLGFVVVPTILGDGRPAAVLPTASALTSNGSDDQLPHSLPTAIRQALAGLHSTSGLTQAESIPTGGLGAGPRPQDSTCTTVPLSSCTLVQGGPGAKRVLLLGDSHAEMLLPALRVIARQEDLTLVLASQRGCPWMDDLVFANSGTAFYQTCAKIKQDWYTRLIPEFRPDVLIVASRATDHKQGVSYHFISPDHRWTGSPSAILIASATETLRRLKMEVPKIVVVQPVPIAPDAASGAACVQTHSFADQCVFTSDSLPSRYEQGLQSLAAGDSPLIKTISLDPLLCPRLPTCDPLIGGTLVRRDTDHLTDRMAAQIAPQLDVLLHNVDALP